MKKPLIYGTIAGALGLASLGGTLIVANSNATTNESNNKIAQESEFSRENISVVTAEKNETVYLLTDADGTPKSTFVGNNLYTGDEKLPFEFGITYYLDGQKITASDLAGKSGHVKIVWSYKSALPFVAGTSVKLDGAKFSNVKVLNGKILNEGEKYLIAGYSFPGVNESLGTDFLPKNFTIEADVTDFALDTTYTVLLNDLIADIDTAKLNDLDSVVAAVSQLADGANQLSDGLDTALSGAKKLKTGADQLASGVDQLSTGANKLADGINYLTNTYDESLQTGAKKVIASTLKDVNTKLSGAAAVSSYLPITTDNYAKNLEAIYAATKDDSLLNAKGLLDLATGVIGYTSAVEGDIRTGANTLAGGLSSVNKEMPALAAGAGALVNGLDELYRGSVKMDDGVSKLADFAKNDLAGFTNNLRKMVAAAKGYKNFSNPKAESVKFIVKTAQIK